METILKNENRWRRRRSEGQRRSWCRIWSLNTALIRCSYFSTFEPNGWDIRYPVIGLQSFPICIQSYHFIYRSLHEREREKARTGWTIESNDLFGTKRGGAAEEKRNEIEMAEKTKNLNCDRSLLPLPIFNNVVESREEGSEIGKSVGDVFVARSDGEERGDAIIRQWQKEIPKPPASDTRFSHP